MKKLFLSTALLASSMLYSAYCHPRHILPIKENKAARAALQSMGNVKSYAQINNELRKALLKEYDIKSPDELSREAQAVINAGLLLLLEDESLDEYLR